MSSWGNRIMVYSVTNDKGEGRENTRAVPILAGRRDEGREKVLKDIKEAKEMSRVCKTGKRNRKKWGGMPKGGLGTRLDLIFRELTWEILTTQEAVNLRTSFKCQRHKLIYLIRKICLYCTPSNFPEENWLPLQLELLYKVIPHSPTQPRHMCTHLWQV